MCESEREAQGVNFYLGKVRTKPKAAAKTFRVGKGRSGWNVKKGEYHLDIEWYTEFADIVFEVHGTSDTQLLEMLIERPDGKTGQIQLDEVAPPPLLAGQGRGRRRSPAALSRKARYKLHADFEALLLDQNYTKYVDRAAHGSSA